MNEFDIIKSPLAGTNLIEASAGTGKTYTISVIFLRLILENNFRIEDILVVTFTIAATAELKMRIRDRLKDALNAIEGKDVEDKNVLTLMSAYKNDISIKHRITTALKNFNQASVFTIHSFCRQILVDNAFESGSLFNSEIAKDDFTIEQGVADLCRKTFYSSSHALASYFMKNCSPEKLFKSYKNRPLSSELIIRPENNDADLEEFENADNAIIELYSELSLAWERESETVIDILYNPKILKGKIYSKKLKAGLIENMREYLSNDNPFEIFNKNLREKLYYFSSGKIKESLEEGNEYPECEVFEISQKLYDAIESYNRLGSSILVGIKKRLFEFIDGIILDKKNINNRRTFNDLVKDVHSGLEGELGKNLCSKLRDRYRAALIDEFQDTDDLQFDIFNNFFNNGRTIMFLIGDPKQAIYRFRGADIFSYIKASKLMENRYTLIHNWRSRPELIECINAVFKRCSNPFIIDDIRFDNALPGDEDQGPVLCENGNALPSLDIWLAKEEGAHGKNELVKRLAAEISLLINRDGTDSYTLEGKRINPGDIAVLVRTRAEGLEVRNAFSAYNIPSVSRRMDNVFSTEDAYSLYYIVSAVADPSNNSLIKAAASTMAIGMTAELIYDLNMAAGSRLSDLAARFYSYRDKWISEGFFSMISDLFDGESVPSRLFALHGGERMIANMNQIAEILNETEHANGFTPKELVSWFWNTISYPQDSDEYMMRLERDDDAVNIVTMHACKGLEFPIVYCPFVSSLGKTNSDDFIIHDEESGKSVMYLDENVPEDIKNIKKMEELAENTRLLYVALTRAKSLCRVMLFNNRNMPKTAAYYIFVKNSGYASADKNTDPLASAICSLSKSTDGKIKFMQGGTLSGKKYIAEEYSNDKISVRLFNGDVKESWKIHSYSAIVHNYSSQSSDGKDFKYEYDSVGLKGDGIFGFPSGPIAGLCIHEIFENTDFSLKDLNALSEICSRTLEKYRYDVSSSIHISNMFFNVVNTILDKTTGLKLSDIGMKSRLSEMEFDFPVDRFDFKKFSEVFDGRDRYCEIIHRKLHTGRSQPGGFMKGFIDLIFEFKNRYYIVDWKSNHLGNSYEDYASEKILDEMEKHNYFLQYYIYSVALNRFLKQRSGEGYNYEDNFGGVYYLFVRGMTPYEGENFGVFFDKPDKITIEKLDRFFRGY